MIESSFLSPSWELDKYPDWSLPPIDNMDCIYNWNGEDTCSACDFSSSSSDVDAFNLCDLQIPIPLSEEFVSRILGDNIADIDGPLNEFYDLSTCSGDRNNSVTSANKINSLEQFSKSWSNMCLKEKEKSLLHISEVTCQMAIGEQVEVIKIIDPCIEISADMKEFTLDISLLNDVKWKKIKDFFKKHKVSFPDSTDASIKLHKKIKTAKSFPKNFNSVSRTSRKQRQKKEKVLTRDEEYKKLKRKQVRQGVKEERSGLFVYEKIIKKLSSLEEDEDVDILE